MRIGDLVRHKDPRGLHCGSGIYPYAVVMSEDPLILVSEEGDMWWDKQAPDDLKVVGRAGLSALVPAMRRFAREYRRLLEDSKYLQLRMDGLQVVNNELKDAMGYDGLTAQQDLVELRARVRAWWKTAGGVYLVSQPLGGYPDAVEAMMDECNKDVSNEL